MPPKSIFRQPGTKHFQLVHRSQRDPLIHDPDASAHVLKQVVRENEKKGKSRAELEASINPADLHRDIEANVGEASLFGVFYDDTQYNYMQHLRTAGVQEDGVESILLEAPTSSSSAKKPTQSKSQKERKAERKEKMGIELKDLPQEALPSASELPRTYDNNKAIPDSLSGFNPNMDPHLRQALEALEDEAFVDDGMEGDDFFGDLVGGGEREDDDEFDFEFDEDGLEGEDYVQEEERDPESMTWEERFERFKREKKMEGAAAGAASDDDEDNFDTEAGDTISGLPAFSVIGGKKRRKGASDASGYSMSSSSMFRNEALQTLDERFDQLISKEYEDEDEDDASDDASIDSAPDLLTSRADFNSMISEFNDLELLGRKLKPKLAGETAAEKFATFRRALGEAHIRDGADEDADNDADDQLNEFLTDRTEEKKDRWDCETILTTYSSMENHPRLIRARDTTRTPKIVVDPKTGLPTTAEKLKASKRTRDRVVTFDDEEHTTESDNEELYGPVRETIKRSKEESPEEKKARKAAVKAERASRRVDKKSKKEMYNSETKTQMRIKNQQDTERGRRTL